ncbi:MAG TPA: response regulator, partial [Thermodesulfovibrionales bacterium]|nr:response regulator [Thermodesulfovibrionales bacterium]
PAIPGKAIISMKNEVIIAEGVYALLRDEQSFLSRADVRIRTTGSNSQALEMHRTERADLIIAALDAGEMSGEELCGRIRDDAAMRSVSILLVCGSDESEISRCMNCSANAYVSLPAPPAILLQEAHRLLNIAPRKTCRVPVKIRVDGKVRGRRFTGTAENISTSGMLIWSSDVLVEGDTVQCSFSLSGSRQVTVPGEVVRVLPGNAGAESGYGVSFVDISTEAVSAIRRFSGEKQADCA